MPREFNRPSRLAEQIQRELAQLLLTGVKDPRLAGLTVSGVELSRDLAHARVFLTFPLRVEHGPTDERGDGAAPEDEAEILGVLRKAAGYLRRELARRLHVRSVPELTFERDDTLARADRIERLLAGARTPT